LLIDTLKTNCCVDSERAGAEVMSGGGVMASARQSETSPRELKAQEGIE
jgi:poly(3-hydroxybutyrate) depolymerase